MAMMNEFSVLN